MKQKSENDHAIAEVLEALGDSIDETIKEVFLKRPENLTQNQIEKWEGANKINRNDLMSYNNLLDDRLQIKVNNTVNREEKRRIKRMRICIHRFGILIQKFEKERTRKKEEFERVKESVKPEAYKEGYRFPVDTAQLLILLFIKKENQAALFDRTKPLAPIRQDDFKDFNEFVRNPSAFNEKWLNEGEFSCWGSDTDPFQDLPQLVTLTRLKDNFPEYLNFRDKKALAEYLQTESIEERLTTLAVELRKTRDFSLPTIKEKISQNKTLPGFLNHPYTERLAEELRNEFCAERGLSIRYMIEGLKKRSIVFTENRQQKAVYNAIKTDFETNIGSYQSVFPGLAYDLDWNALDDPKHPKNPDFQEIDSRLMKVLNKLSDK